jgi:hypothetical protein
VRIKPSTLTHSLVFTSATEAFGTAEKGKLQRSTSYFISIAGLAVVVNMFYNNLKYRLNIVMDVL